MAKINYSNKRIITVAELTSQISPLQISYQCITEYFQQALGQVLDLAMELDEVAGILEGSHLRKSKSTRVDACSKVVVDLLHTGNSSKLVTLDLVVGPQFCFPQLH